MLDSKKSVVEVQNIKKSFGSFKALDGVSLEIKEGELFGLLGPNGAGKSTLAKILTGQLKADSGNVLINNLPLSQNYSKLKSIFSIVPQEPCFYFAFTVKQNLEFFGSLNGLSGKALKERTAFLMAWLNLTQFANRKATNLSGGYQRLLNIALSLLNNPKLLFLDEPTAGLDPTMRQLFWKKLDELRIQGTTICITTHYMDEAQQLCDRIALVVSGKLLMQGTPNSLVKLFGGSRIFVLKLSREIEDSLIKELELALPHYPVAGIKDMLVITFNQFSFLEKAGAINEIILKQNYQVLSSSIKEPDLEDVFIRLTGQGLNV